MRSGARPPSPEPRGPRAGDRPRSAGAAPPDVGRDVLEQAVAESPDGLLGFDGDGRVTLVNAAAERMLGVAEHEAQGRPAAELLPGGAAGAGGAVVRSALAGTRGAAPECPLPSAELADASSVVALQSAPLRDARGGVAGGLVILRDVTARRDAEAARAAAERAVDRARRLQALTAALSEAATVEQVAEVIVYKGMEAIGADAGSLALISASSRGEPQFEIVRTSGFATEVVSRYRFYPITPGRPLSDAVRHRVPVLLESTAAWVERYANVAYETPYPAFEGFAGIPIVSRGRVLAGVSFSFRAAQTFDDGLRTFLGTLSEQCAQALERAWLFEGERQARAAAEAARAAAQAASHAKGEFLATMSHELRTPLNAIAGYSDLLLMRVHGPLNDAQRADLERLQRSQRQLLALVEDVLSFANLDAGRTEYAIAEVDVAAVLDAAADAAAPRLAAKGVELVREAVGPHARALADADKLRRVLLNLLANATKFTDAGGRVTLAAAAHGETVEIVVRDSGRGIPAAEHEAIFAPFTQLEHGYTRTADGSGLGLTIARDMARGMGGDVRVDSELGAGAAFTVVLPRA